MQLTAISRPRVDFTETAEQLAGPPVNHGAPGVFGAALPDVIHALARRRTHRRSMRLIAVLGDITVIIAGFSIGATVRYGNPVDFQALQTIAAFLPSYLLLALTQHAYTMDSIARARISAPRAAGSLFLAIALTGLMAFFLQAVGGVSRSVVGLGTGLSIVFLSGFRTWLAIYAHRLLGDVSINEVVIQDAVSAHVHSGSIVLDAARDGISLRLDSPVMLDRLGRCLHAADRVVVCCQQSRRASWVAALKSSNVNAEILTSELDEVGAIGLSHYNGTTTLKVASASLAVPDQILKRALDITLACLAALILAPLLLSVALAIKLDSRGPVFFRQPRVGLGNRVFQILKFRSMRSAHKDVNGSKSTERNDGRVTRIGALIRKTSVDELPQLFNVLRGDMSIVGPRPHPLDCRAEDRLFWDIDRRYWQRHAVKPGMTGLAQVRGFRGATEKESDLTDRLQADLEYVAGWSVWRDLGIIVATFRVLTHRNAY